MEEVQAFVSPLGAFPSVEELIRFVLFAAGAAYGATQIVRTLRDAALSKKYPNLKGVDYTKWKKYSRWALRAVSLLVGIASVWWMMRSQWALPIGIFSGAFSSTLVKYGKRLLAKKAGVTLDEEEK